jgi:hypothetical protein
MSSIVSICNLALSNLGKDNISALTDEGAEAKACNQFYDHVRDTLLQVYPWNFAGKSASLAEVTNDKAGQWRYAYRRPTDCLKIRYVRPQYIADDPNDYSAAQTDAFGFAHEVEGQTIYCDLSPAFLRYTSRLTDPTKYSADVHRNAFVASGRPLGDAADARSQDARRRLSACPGNPGPGGGIGCKRGARNLGS